MKVAVVGSGPSGFYAVEALLSAGQDIEVDLYERLPVPFGLVRHGVAPDHPRLKSVSDVFEKIAQTPKLTFFGNIQLGRDIHVNELAEHYDAVLIAIGASADRKLGIRGEELKGVHSASEFVGWYNGHPDYRDISFDFSHNRAVVVGLGNVALDVCRILLKSVGELRCTDIAEHALDALAESKIKEVVLVGRGGPADAKFSPKELREITELPGIVTHVNLRDFDDVESVVPGSVSAKNIEILRRIPHSNGAAEKTCSFRFHSTPEGFDGRQRLTGMTFASRDNCKPIKIEAGLVIRSVGYRGEVVDGLPFDDATGTIPNEQGRVIGISAPLYVAGWIKRGPTGIIGTNRACSLATVERLLNDMKTMPRRNSRGSAGVAEILERRSARPSSYADWNTLDHLEQMAGRKLGKPRQKFTRIHEMLAAIDRP
ncbi:FAD-dependent oxidoreductase [Sinorhizobium sp. 8-89]|uniref:FAD-dependent oxidoreductase n=1 Tax=Sinorhizobium sp. 7-81 TaxID=3049087 RepID=UPI0024C27726|nr:FAD-dependent oxidoreductase [Sinorhizobium sp. 7-81]MDK1386501.1 FAD-dependent oxidoreductase [Sinorhizobium sp. 7-81]